MKKKEINELKNKPIAELTKMLSDNRKRLRDLSFDLAAGKVKDVAEIRTIRKDIARILTFVQISKSKEQKNGK